MQTIAPNMVIRWETAGSPPRFERLLVQFGGPKKTWGVIDVYAKSGMPTISEEEEILDGLKSGVATFADDPYDYVLGLSDADLTDAQKDERNSRWKILQPLVKSKAGHPLLDKGTRGQAIQKAAEEHKIPVPKLYELVRRFYQRGQTEFALVPDYHRCGAAEEERGSTDAKRGRPPKHGKEVINITPEIASKLNAGLDKFYRDEKLSFADALDKTKRTYFLKRCYFDGARKRYILLPWAELITIGQAKYHYLKHIELPALARRRAGAKKYQKDLRGLSGDSTAMSWGPGALYMIDSTTGDTYLRHPWTHKPIGRPTVYLVIDVYSHMVVGFHVTFEPPSMIAAALAIEQAIRDKAEVLRELNLEIPPEYWPAKGKPFALLGDRGELISKAADGIPARLGCELETARAYSGDAKGIVEQAFRQTNLHSIQWTDGSVSEDRERDDPHPRRITTVHPCAFCQVLAVGLIDRNSDEIDGYPLGKEHYGAGVPRRPLKLWNWGMDNRTGFLLPMERKHVFRKLLPRVQARSTRNGLFFKGVTFSNARLDQEEWFSIPAIKAHPRMIIAIDARSIANTFLVPGNPEADLEPLQLRSTWAGRSYGELSWQELQALFKGDQVAKVKAAGADLARRTDTRGYQEQLLEESKAHFENTTPHPATDGLSTKDDFRGLETKYGGAANVPLTPPKGELLAPPDVASSAPPDTDDEEHAEIIEELLDGLKPQ